LERRAVVASEAKQSSCRAIEGHGDASGGASG